MTIYNHLQDFEEVARPQGKRQWNNRRFGGSDSNPAFMMLAVDMSLGWDPTYRKHVHWYDRHRNEYRRDAARVWHKLCGLGCEGILTPEKAAAPLP